MRSADENLALSTARKIAEASDEEVAHTMVRLRSSKRLFETVHGLNRLLSVPEHSRVAMQALKRIGLDYAG